MIVHINGMPGVGKFTTAKTLADILPARLIDNHLIIDLVLSVCERGSSTYIEMINSITAIVHKTLIDQPKKEVLIFTNALAKGTPEDEARLEAIRNLAIKMNTPFVPVLLSCTEEQNIVRLIDPERKKKRKLMDPDTLKHLIRNYKIAHPYDHVNALEIDTTNLSGEESAQRIKRHLQSCLTIEG